ncbi:hypothetical protein C8P63_11184 [Melghirimyces profundicolus]|uniref:Uncharacterized protein n=1 Tax=Melghirimyces profundicolus TaxID=1242148 RepID=A0A2T6BUA8_9BACL|nr:hypothetical protein C8P63_11184 [Melghirimyces profundicolus]
MQLADLRPHLHPQFGVQVGQRFVHQEHLGFTHDGPAEGHPLALTPGECFGFSVQQVFDVENFGRFLYPLVDFVLLEFPKLQAEGHVLVNVHMGIQGVALEHHGDVPILGGNVVDQPVTDVQLPFRNFFQSGDHPKGGGFPATGGSDQNQKLLIFDMQVKVGNSRDVPIPFVDVAQFDFSHDETPFLHRLGSL